MSLFLFALIHICLPASLASALCHLTNHCQTLSIIVNASDLPCTHACQHITTCCLQDCSVLQGLEAPSVHYNILHMSCTRQTCHKGCRRTHPRGPAQTACVTLCSSTYGMKTLSPCLSAASSTENQSTPFSCALCIGSSKNLFSCCATMLIDSIASNNLSSMLMCSVHEQAVSDATGGTCCYYCTPEHPPYRALFIIYIIASSQELLSLPVGQLNSDADPQRHPPALPCLH